MSENKPDNQNQPSNLGEAIEMAKDAISDSLSCLQAFSKDARGDLTSSIRLNEELLEKVNDLLSEIICETCKNYNNDGEGYNGLCGNCADIKEA